MKRMINTQGMSYKSSALRSHITGKTFGYKKGDFFSFDYNGKYGSACYFRLELTKDHLDDILPYLQSTIFQDGFEKHKSLLVRSRTDNKQTVCLNNDKSGASAYARIDDVMFDNLIQFLRIRVGDDWEDLLNEEF